jgi:hypothetical protein
VLLFIIGATHALLHLKAMQGVGSRGGTTLKPFIIADCGQLGMLYPFLSVTQSQSAVAGMTVTLAIGGSVGMLFAFIPFE